MVLHTAPVCSMALRPSLQQFIVLRGALFLILSPVSLGLLVSVLLDVCIYHFPTAVALKTGAYSSQIL